MVKINYPFKLILIKTRNLAKHLIKSMLTKIESGHCVGNLCKDRETERDREREREIVCDPLILSIVCVHL